jgi:hypothetical protein
MALGCMELKDLKWALGEFVSAALRPRHVDCECHPRLAYQGPRRDGSASRPATEVSDETDAAAKPIDK